MCISFALFLLGFVLIIFDISVTQVRSGVQVATPLPIVYINFISSTLALNEPRTIGFDNFLFYLLSVALL